MSNSVTPLTAADQASLSITNYRACSNWRPLSQWYHPTIISIAPFSSCTLIFPTIRVFSNKSTLPISWPVCWNFSISPSNEYSGLISLRIDWFNLAVQVTLRNPLQNLSRTIVRKHQFFGTQLSLWYNSYPYMSTGKTIALTIWIFVRKVVSLLLNMLSRFVIAFLLISKHLFILWLHSLAAVILEP